MGCGVVEGHLEMAPANKKNMYNLQFHKRFVEHFQGGPNPFTNFKGYETIQLIGLFRVNNQCDRMVSSLYNVGGIATYDRVIGRRKVYHEAKIMPAIYF